ncbi:MAG TPA: hypothetical protein VGH66_17925 [Acidimicrobiales bacterium]|jgi:hypothetical protein
MTLVAFVSGRSPGLTTSLHVLAATWPPPAQALVAELDPDGGTLGLRHQIPSEPGLTTLAAAGRRGLAPDTVGEHCQRLSDDTAVLLGPVAPDRAASALAVLGPRLGVALDAMAGVDVLADCGRIHPRSPSADVVRAARYVVIVVTPTLEGVAQAQSRLAGLDLPPGRLAVMTVGRRPYDPIEVANALQVAVLGSLADDRRAALELNAGRLPRRSELWQSATALGAELAARLVPLGVAADQESAAGPSALPLAVPSADPAGNRL